MCHLGNRSGRQGCGLAVERGTWCGDPHHCPQRLSVPAPGFYLSPAEPQTLTSPSLLGLELPHTLQAARAVLLALCPGSELPAWPLKMGA